MIIGCTKELKNHEYRVGLTPDNVMAYISNGHQVYIETGAGEGAGFSDDEYDDPIFIEEGIVHYCVGNMPGAVPRTSTVALTNTTLRYGLSIANNGLEKAIELDSGLKNGLNTYDGKCMNKNVSIALGYKM